MAKLEIKLDVSAASKLRGEVPASALARWTPTICAAGDEPGAINMYAPIGAYEGEVGTKMVASILRNMKGKAVTVNLNSPGGDFFEGVAIYNLLREYEGEVKVRVVGMAASAASIIAMAGDEVEIAESAFLMIHNAWTIALGNKDDMRETAAMLGKFDESMARVYEKRAGMDYEEIVKMMDNETWLSGKEAVEMGFADSLLASDRVEEREEHTRSFALRTVDVALAKQGMPRSKRRELLKELGTPSAAEPTPSAGIEGLQMIAAALKTHI